jgi:hypothetical protein
MEMRGRITETLKAPFLNFNNAHIVEAKPATREFPLHFLTETPTQLREVSEKEGKNIVSLRKRGKGDSQET